MIKRKRGIGFTRKASSKRPGVRKRAYNIARAEVRKERKKYRELMN